MDLSVEKSDSGNDFELEYSDNVGSPIETASNSDSTLFETSILAASAFLSQWLGTQHRLESVLSDVLASTRYRLVPGFTAVTISPLCIITWSETRDFASVIISYKLPTSIGSA